ncbi:MAG: methyltransferase domain-containing protein [Clostridia bacterium]|nr:methyltransferase domain-containing protein [Clostridia bacterium]
MDNDRDYLCYETLMKVFRDNAYASIALNDALAHCRQEDKPYITKFFYGVLERNVYYEYVLANYAASKPKKPIAVIVKMGYYLLENMRLPSYAAVNNMVRLCKKAGKGGAAGFVNSALRNFGSVELPQQGTAAYLSVCYGYPQWLCNRLIADYGYDFTYNLLSYVPDTRTHIRVNIGSISQNAFEMKYLSGITNGEIEKSVVGYYVSGKALAAMDKKDYVIQSASSVAAVHAYTYGLPHVSRILDICAAPGGKAVLLSQISGANVIACDIHTHRVELIKKYAARCKANVTAMQNDATVFRPEWEEQFELVVCDVPCSGVGVAGSKPDILFNRAESDVSALVAVQRNILQTASRYVKKGGRLCYSTCSILKQENGEIVRAFSAEKDEFMSERIKSPLDDCEREEIELFPHIHHTDGFYVAAWKKIK